MKDNQNPKSWKPEVQVAGEGEKWHDNAVRFATKEEAELSAKDLFGRWMLATAWRAAPSDDPVNYKIVDGVMSAVKSEVRDEA